MKRRPSSPFAKQTDSLPPSAPLRKRILLLDDHPMMRMGMAQLIDGEPDLEVCYQAGHVDQALIEIPRCKPDLIITDLTLPGKGGLELIKDLQALHPELPVLVISMHDELLHAERVLRAGARGYLMKEAGGERMLLAIRQVLAGKVYVSDRMSAKILDVFSGRKGRTGNSPIDLLSDREFQVFQLIGQGRSTREIAEVLHLSSKTVDVHRAHIKEKLQLKDATGLVRYAVRWVEAQNAGNAPSL